MEMGFATAEVVRAAIAVPAAGVDDDEVAGGGAARSARWGSCPIARGVVEVAALSP
jgi:hypothetical protein